MSPEFNPSSTDRVTPAVDNGPRLRLPGHTEGCDDVETFHGYDFDTMTETDPATFTAVVPHGPARDDLEVDGDVSFMRGVMYGLLFTIPCWVVIAGAVLAVLD